MSTYTDLHMCRRENLTILRRPGTAEDGITPQRVIFANPDNIYEGSFKGKIDSTDVKLSSATLTDVTINGGVINEAMIKSDGQVISMSELTSNVSEISNKLDNAIDVISTDIVNAISGAVDASLTALSTAVFEDVNERLDAFEDEVFNEMSAVSSFLSDSIYAEECERIEQDGILDGKIYTVSKSLSDHIGTFNAFSSVMSSTFAEHVEDNIQTFSFLSNYMLSTVEHDRHYVITHPSPEKTPYEAKDFAINIIKTGTLDVKIEEMQEVGGKVIGYGTYQPDNKLEIRLDISKSPDLMDYVFNQPTYTDVLTEGVEKLVKTNDDYRMSWLSSTTGQEIVLRKTSITESALKSPAHGSLQIGYIDNPVSINPSAENKKFLSGVIRIDPRAQQSDFGVFYEAFNGQSIVSGEVLVDDALSCSISYEDDDFNYARFRFDRDIETRVVTPLIATDNSRFGFVRDSGLAKDDQDKIVSLTAEGLTLPPEYNGYLSSIVLTDATSPKFMASLGNGLWISADVAGNSALFDVVELMKMYKYEFHPASELTPPFSSKGYVVPVIVNKTLSEDDSFDYLSVMTDFVDDDHVIEWRNTYCLTKSVGPTEITWKYEDGDPEGVIHDFVSIVMRKNGSAFLMTINFKDHQTGFELKDKSYTIDVNNPVEYPAGSTQTQVLKSKTIDFTFDTVEKIPGHSWYIIGEQPRDVTGDTYHLPVTDFGETGLEIKVPKKPDNCADVSREFIVATYVNSLEDYVEVKLRNEAGDPAKIISPGHQKFVIPTKQWTSFKVTEIMQDKYLFTDLDDVMIRHRFDKIENDLSNEVEARVEADAFLSGAIDSNKSEIDDLWKNIRGGLNYQGMLSIDEDYSTVSGFIGINYDYDPPKLFREGFFYVIQSQDKKAHYKVEGIEVEHGDWFIINHNTEFSAMTSAYIDVFDAEDYDNFKLYDNNIATGDNVFNGSTTLNKSTTLSGENTIVGSNVVDGSLSVKSSTVVEGYTTIVGDTDVVGGLSVVSAQIASEHVAESTIESLSVADATTKNIDAEDIEATNVDIDVAGISSLTAVNALAFELSTASLCAELKDFIYGNGLSTMESLTASLQGQITSAQLSIDGISSFVKQKTPYMMHYFGTLSAGYGQQRTFAQFLHENFSNDDEHQFVQGDQYRISAEISIVDGQEELLKLYANDYITFNQDVVLANATKECVDIIRDAQSEGEDLQKQLNALCSYADSISASLSTLSGEVYEVSTAIMLSVNGLSASISGLSSELNETSSYVVSALQLSAMKPLNDLSNEVSAISSAIVEDINYLSSQLSGYNSTLSGIDRSFDSQRDISSDNLILTDVNLAGSQEHTHQRYYMTFLSGTIVLKPIA